MEQKNCVICGKIFEPKKGRFDQVTCSQECQKIRNKQLVELRHPKKEPRPTKPRKPPSDRIRTGFRERELELAMEIVRFGAPPAGRCPQCGKNDWLYRIMRVGSGDILKAECTNIECAYQRYFNSGGRFWTLPVWRHNRAMKDGFEFIEPVEKEEAEAVEADKES